ncbi:MAG TPA: iron chelate uptake ABC transporter family permease subunit [Kiritimatiellia bacterium]|nr:iron chelate uptake ABC transporter family permease subunit [Kiritimatiellia bacterium]
MIGDFLASWPLFQHAYLGGWMLAILLALLGVQLVARDQIFFGAAVAQASTLGIAIALVTAAWHPFGWHLHHTEWYPRLWAVACSVLAAMSIEFAAGRRESREAVTGFIFIFASAAAMVLVARSPFGLDEVQRLLASSLIGATALDVRMLSILLAATVLLIAMHRNRLLLLAIDPACAAAAGVRVRAWSIALAAWFAIVTGLSIRTAGLLYTFGCLILPVLAAKQLAREMRTLFWLAPLLGLGCAILAFLCAHTWDYPSAQLAALFQGALLALLWLVRAVARRRGPTRTN